MASGNSVWGDAIMCGAFYFYYGDFAPTNINSYVGFRAATQRPPPRNSRTMNGLIQVEIGIHGLAVFGSMVSVAVRSCSAAVTLLPTPSVLLASVRQLSVHHRAIPGLLLYQYR